MNKPETTSKDIKVVLVPTDLSIHGQAAVAHATTIGERLGARVDLYHAVEDSEAHGAEEDARGRLFETVAGTQARCDVVVDRVAGAREGVLACLEARRPDLVVLSTHTWGGLPVLHPGSISGAMLAAFRPVLCVGGATSGARLPYARLLVPTDMSGQSNRAFPVALLIARAFRAEVVGLHVATGRFDTLDSLADPFAQMVSVSDAVKARYEHAFGDLHPRVIVVDHGSPGREILRKAHEEHADLVVLSTHGHDTLGDRLLGSNAEHIARHAPCPVLIV